MADDCGFSGVVVDVSFGCPCNDEPLVSEDLGLGDAERECAEGADSVDFADSACWLSCFCESRSTLMSAPFAVNREIMGTPPPSWLFSELSFSASLQGF